jgi:hypothetical protein
LFSKKLLVAALDFYDLYTADGLAHVEESERRAKGERKKSEKRAKGERKQSERRAEGERKEREKRGRGE